MKCNFLCPAGGFVCKKCWPACTGVTSNCVLQMVFGINSFLFLSFEHY
jgi:hypothetical protein